ncbi:hypothetical protein D3C73_1255710 [compost metagenome]
MYFFRPIEFVDDKVPPFKCLHNSYPPFLENPLVLYDVPCKTHNNNLMISQQTTKIYYYMWNVVDFARSGFYDKHELSLCNCNYIIISQLKIRRHWNEEVLAILHLIALYKGIDSASAGICRTTIWRRNSSGSKVSEDWYPAYY